MLDRLSFDCLYEDGKNCLERRFQDTLVSEVERSLTANKASGPVGFSLTFIQTCCEIVKEVIIKVFPC